MSLVKHTDTGLHQPCHPFNFSDSPITAKEIADLLILTKNSQQGLGLAANQVGIPLQVFAMFDEVCFNPEILEFSSFSENRTEGCLTYPGLWVTIKRSKLVKVRYQNEEGQVVERDLDELESRVFQHELDHLHGRTMLDRASTLKLRRAVEQAIKHGYHYDYSELYKSRKEI